MDKNKIMQNSCALIYAFGFFLVLGAIGARDTQTITGDIVLTSTRIVIQIIIGISLMWITALPLNSTKIKRHNYKTYNVKNQKK